MDSLGSGMETDIFAIIRAKCLCIELYGRYCMHSREFHRYFLPLKSIFQIEYQIKRIPFAFIPFAYHGSICAQMREEH